MTRNRESYRVILSHRFIRELRKHIKGYDLSLHRKVKESLLELGKDPYLKRSRLDVKLISKHSEGTRRLRVGDYRIIFSIDDTSKTIYVTKIFRREKGY